jgi:hypothetical protein
MSCRSTSGDRESDCDTPSLDAVVLEPLRALAACQGAEAAHGLLSLGFDADFNQNRLDNFTVGKSTTLTSGSAKQLVRCAEKELARASLQGISHRKASYRVFYRLEFGADNAASSNTEQPQNAGELVAASGRVTVTWEAALVRAKPKDGEVVARVLGGTRLTVIGRLGDWYRVKYDAKGSEGWVFKAAIGL